MVRPNVRMFHLLLGWLLRDAFSHTPALLCPDHFHDNSAAPFTVREQTKLHPGVLHSEDVLLFCNLRAVTSPRGQTAGIYAVNPKEEKQAACFQVQSFTASELYLLKKRWWLETGHGFPRRKANCLNHLWLFHTTPPLSGGQILHKLHHLFSWMLLCITSLKHAHPPTHTGRRQRGSKVLVTIFVWWNILFHQQQERNNIGLTDSCSHFFRLLRFENDFSTD